MYAMPISSVWINYYLFCLYTHIYACSTPKHSGYTACMHQHRSRVYAIPHKYINSAAFEHSRWIFVENHKRMLPPSPSPPPPPTPPPLPRSQAELRPSRRHRWQSSQEGVPKLYTIKTQFAELLQHFEPDWTIAWLFRCSVRAGKHGGWYGTANKQYILYISIHVNHRDEHRTPFHIPLLFGYCLRFEWRDASESRFRGANDERVARNSYEILWNHYGSPSLRRITHQRCLRI